MADRTQPPRIVDQPSPGFFRIRVIRGGPWVGARIFTRFGMLTAEINGNPADPFQVWHGGEFIDEARYNMMMDGARIDAYRPVHVSDAGLADAIREANELDYWLTQPIR